MGGRSFPRIVRQKRGTTKTFYYAFQNQRGKKNNPELIGKGSATKEYRENSPISIEKNRKR